MTDLSLTIEPKVDQLTADALIGGPITVKITNVTGNDDPAQPISIHYEGDNGMPFKPCKTQRRVLVHVWGKDGKQYAGRSLTLYRDPTVAFGGLVVGGVRISHMSNISSDVVLAVTAKRGSKKPVTIKPLKAPVAQLKAVEASDDAEPFDWSAFETAVDKTLSSAIDPDALTAWWDEQKALRLQARASDKVKAGAVATRVSGKIAELAEALSEA